MITVIDYGMGNLKSVGNALKYLNIDYKISENIKDIKEATGIILPGVGGFPNAIERLRERELDLAIKKRCEDNVPLLGICLGMQLLFNKSYEGGAYKGLSLIEGEVLKLQGNVKIPQIGWNSLEFNELFNYKSNPLLKGINKEDFVYYVHSFYGKVKDNKDLIAYSSYGENKVAGIVQRGNVFGTQFHPEKSGEIGLRIIKNFGELIK
ncbi:MAG: imidazole glycerol phosphate synthase subunit HisH [Clostridium perfringens]|nr:imidazole glycerol phosphate synthase subunit HisH [Clostridium perfringens]